MRQDHRLLILFTRLWAVLMLASAIMVAAPAASIAAAPPAVTSAAAPDASGLTCQVLQPGPTVAKDAYIKQEKVDERRGTDPELRIKTETGKLQRALLQFDLSSIPANSVIVSAALSLWVKDATGGPVTINAHAVTASWKETEVTWKARDKAAALLWTALGADYNATVVSSTVVDDTKNIWRSWDMTGLAPGWVATPSSNLGVILESPVTNPKTEKKFKSSDDGTASQRPKLEVCYTAAITVEPDNTGDGVAGLTRTYAHVVRIGNLTTAVSLSAVSNQSWPTRIYRDVNGNGLKDPEDTVIAVTPAIGPNAEYPILVQVDVPISAPAGIVDVTTVTATAQSGGASASAIDRTRIGRMLNLQPDQAMKATAGTVLFYGHTLTNSGDSRDCTTITVASSQGWTVFLWDDLNRNGVHETANPNEPALSNPVCLDPGEVTYLVAEVRVPAGAAAGVVEQTVLRVVSGNSPGRFDTATDTTTVFVDSPPVIDGKYDSIYTDSPYSEEVCYTDVNGVLFGKLATYYQATGDAVYMVLAIDKDFVDNTYGTNAIGWSGGHTFGNLTGSDHAQFIGYDSNGALVLDIKVDYLTSTTGTPSGYASLGVTGGEGDVNVGSAASIQAWGTSLDYSLNDTGYCSGGNCNLSGTDLEVNSPATDAFYTPNATYPNFIYDVIYEVQIAKTAFATLGGSFGSLEVPYIHASPSKVGTNTIYAEPGVCPGEIGDRVWHDQDGDTVQDAGEPGIANVQVKLYQDNGDGYFDSTVDNLMGTRTTSAAGMYLFSDLAPNDYFVDVVDATVPAGYKTTTYNDPTSVIGLDQGESYLTADFGYGLGAPIGDFVWEDLNHNGIQDAGEPGVPWVTVRLLDGSGALLATTTTDPIGAYLFPNRPAGSYQVEFVLPAGYAFTAQGQGGNPVKDSDANPATGRTAVFTTNATPDLNRDAGLIGLGLIGDFVWYDSDADGIQDVGEPGIPNVTLDLYRGNIKVASTVTDADGGYLFPNLPPGNYTIDVSDENGVLASLTHIVAYQSQPDPNGPISLGSGEIYKDADFGYVKEPVAGAAIIGDTVWYDANADKFQQPDEPGIPGIQVCATPTAGGTVRCATTDANGRYLIEVLAGSYNVGPTNPPAGYTLTNPPAPAPVTVAAGQQYLNADFGYDSPSLGSIGNLVFFDANKDGVFNTGDSAMGGVSVDLIRDTNGNLTWESGEPIIATVTTATALGVNNSNYLFSAAPAGAYLVHVSDTNGVLRDYAKSPLGAANTDSNNQVDPYPVALAAGASVITADFGYHPSDTVLPWGVIGNQVWIETDGNGLFNPAHGDFGQAGVTVELWKDGAPYAMTTTGASGDYAFLGLDGGSYSVHVVDDLGVLAGYRLTKLGPNPGQDNNNQAQPYAVTLAVGGRNLTADFGYMLPGAIGDYVWYDTDAEGIQDVDEPGIGNVTVRLYRDNGDGSYNPASDTLVDTAVTDVDGGYLFTGLLTGAYFVDVDQSSAALAGLTHTSGPQSQPDPFGPITLAPAQIYRDADFGYVKQPSSGNAIIGDTVWLDGDGDGLRDPGEPGIPGIQVCATPTAGGAASCDTTDDNGAYLISAPAGTYTVAPVNPPAGYTATTLVPHGPLTVNSGDQYLDADFGYDHPDLARLGGTVWNDLGQDGLLDPGEPGISGVSVDLIRDNGNRVWDTGEPVIATTTTDQDGNYDFEGLPGGNYLVVVSDTQNVLDDFAGTIPGPNQGQDNNNQNQPYPVALSVSGNNTTADFGYVQSGTLDRLGVIGNQVWYESDGNGLYNPEGGDIGIAGVTVTLYRDGAPFDATTTGASGDYVFTSLAAGSYSVLVSDVFGVLFDLTPTVLGPNPGQDNNNQAQPYAISLLAADLNMTADFGYTRPGAIGDFVWYDADADGIQDVSEPGIPNVTLDLYRSGVKVASTVTDADGGYLFPNLPPGTYTVDVTDLNGVLAGLTHIVAYQSQPDPSAAISLGAGELYKDADFGYVKEPVAGKAIIGDTVWYDGNADKFQQPDEPGIPGIQVCAIPTAGGTIACANTDTNGHYLVEVAAGSYNVGPTNPPAGYTLTTPPASLPVTVLAGQQYLSADFGYDSSALGVIGNLVFLDANKDGVFNAGDSPLGGVSVDLIRNTTFNQTWDPGEPIIATVTTGSALGANNSNYLFSAVPAGNYLVHVSDTNGVLTDFNKSPLGAAGADNNNQIDPYLVSIPAGGSNLTADFGYWRMSRPEVGVIGNQVWIEKDGDGLFNPLNGDAGQAGVTVELFRDGQPYGKTTTGASGDYAFVGLPAGNYSVQVSDDFDVLTFYGVTTLGPNPGQDNNNQAQPYAVLLPAGGYNLTGDFGYVVPQNSIGDTVYYDDDRSGAQDPGEDGISGVLVQLFTDNGGVCNQLVRTTTTDGNGKYYFATLPPAHYCVVVPETLAENPFLDGLTRSAGANPHTVNLGVNQNYLDADFGYAGVGTIRGVVYFDLNQDGVQQPGEPGIANVQICLYPDVNKDGVPDSTTPLVCTTTDDSGVYVFPNRLPGGYAMTETDPVGLTSTTNNTIGAVLAVSQGTGLSDNNDFGDASGSSYKLTKTLTTPEPVRPNTAVSFDIRITNTGSTWITVLPLRDQYDTVYLKYTGATPASVDNNDDGNINWTDLTDSFGTDLAPGASFTVQVNFLTLRDTSELPGGVTINTALVQNALADPDGSGPLGSVVALPLGTASDTVGVSQPTAVTIDQISAVFQPDGALLSWTTASEHNIVGFNVFRVGDIGELIQVNGDLIAAQHAGANQGASYSFVDTRATPGVSSVYVLEVIKLDGRSERHGPVEVAAP